MRETKLGHRYVVVTEAGSLRVCISEIRFICGQMSATTRKSYYLPINTKFVPTGTKLIVHLRQGLCRAGSGDLVPKLSWRLACQPLEGRMKCRGGVIADPLGDFINFQISGRCIVQ